MSRKSIGDVRPSQLITTFGPGSIVDLQTMSIIVSGIDNWVNDEDLVIHEPRLERALGVEQFFPARPAEGAFYNRKGTVPTYIFPRFQHCPVCGTLSEIGGGDVEYDSKWQEMKCTAPNCRGRGRFPAPTVPAPFIVACPSGHLDDFPWREYVHGGPTNCNQRMRLFSIGQTGSVADLIIQCECDNATKSVSDAFGRDSRQYIGDCKRRMPWLGAEAVDRTCEHAGELRAMQRGATNGWFPLQQSALKIREAATPIGIALARCPKHQIEKIDSEDKLRQLVEMEMFPSLTEFVVSDVWESIKRMRGEVETTEHDLKWPEWEVLRDADSGGDGDELFLEAGTVPTFCADKVELVQLARKLLEVRALTGFTRIDDVAANVAPIYRRRPNWLPAVEVRGEGIFLELNEEEVQQWESRPLVQQRANAMAEKYAEWERERDHEPTEFPGARFILLHTLSHVLIRQLSLDCGYSASAVRERIYSSLNDDQRMAGILLYTASADSEGSLGGLVDLGAPNRFPDLFRHALKSATRCSSDPLCADHQPDIHSTINGAACHACVLASETSCECFNRFLDRSLLVPTMMSDEMAFFDQSVLD